MIEIVGNFAAARIFNSDFPLTLARWPMASEHCRQTSDFLSYWPGLASGISKIAEK